MTNKTEIVLNDAQTGEVSPCTGSLEALISSNGIFPEGILLERGKCESFYPINVFSNCFIFVLAVDSPFMWKAENDGRIIELSTNPGEIWIHPPLVPFSHYLDQPCSYIMLMISPEILYSFFDEHVQDRKIQFLKNYNINDRNMEAMIRLLCNEIEISNRNGKTYLKSILRSFVNYYIRNYSDYSDKHDDNRDDIRMKTDDIAAAVKYINENIFSDISIDDLASKCGLTKYYFLKKFRKIEGVTPYQYILKLKMEKAREIISSGSIQLIDVAYSLGFSDQSHFTNSFRKYFGEPPGSFKKKTGF